jgi:hypothetical protein
MRSPDCPQYQTSRRRRSWSATNTGYRRRERAAGRNLAVFHGLELARRYWGRKVSPMTGQMRCHRKRIGI